MWSRGPPAGVAGRKKGTCLEPGSTPTLVWGQWEPVSHFKEVLGPKQEVALLAENPFRIPQGPEQQVAKGAEPEEAAWDTVTPIWILPETQTWHPSLDCETWPGAFRYVILGTSVPFSEPLFLHLQDVGQHYKTA